MIVGSRIGMLAVKKKVYEDKYSHTHTTNTNIENSHGPTRDFIAKALCL